MWRSVIVCAFATACCVALGCAPSGEAPSSAADAAFGALREQMMATESPEEKASLGEAFLRSYPDHEHAAGILGAVTYYRSEELGQHAEARAVAEELLAASTDPEARFEIGLVVHELSTKTGEPVDLRAIVDDLAGQQKLDFGQHLDVNEAARRVEDWELALQAAEAAQPFATAHAYRADYPDRDFTDDEVKQRVTRRRAMVQAERGWALVHLDRVDEGVDLFAEAEAITGLNYVGIPETALYRYWGQTELDRGNPERAAELLAADAVMGHDEDALAGLRKAYDALHEDGAGFDEYLWSTRQRFARVADDFTLPDYEGEPVSLSSTTGQVVLLSFWFPT